MEGEKWSTLSTILCGPAARSFCDVLRNSRLLFDVIDVIFNDDSEATMQ